jgi:hypothetical protein
MYRLRSSSVRFKFGTVILASTTKRDAAGRGDDDFGLERH